MNTKTNLITLLIISLALTACEIPGVGGRAQATPSPTALPPTQTQTATLTPAPSATASPTPSATAILTPLPLSGNKPYLMLKQERESRTFLIYDANGVGRKTIELPPEAYVEGLNIELLDTIVSPDGQWLVFHTDFAESLDGSLEIPVTLKLLNITDGTVKTVVDVVKDGYTEKLIQLAGTLKQLYPDHYKPIEDNDWLLGGLIETFKWGIDSIAWSPDSRTLAFAAQIDGLSSDVYLYDLETGVIQQAEDSLHSVTGIRWSPDGKKIVFKNSLPWYIYMGAPELYVINPGKKAVKNPIMLSSQGWIGRYDPFTQSGSPTGDWLSPNLLLVTSQTPDAGLYGIDALNINTGQFTTLWEDIFGGYAIDEKNKIVLVSPSDYTQPENLGLYFITSSGRRTKIFDGMYYLGLFFRGGEKHRFLVTGMNGNMKVSYPMTGTLGLGLDGKPTVLDDSDPQQKISISPDYAWLLIWDNEKLDLYDKNDELVKTFRIHGIQRIIWRPDSQAIFYSTKSELYILPLPAGEPKWVDNARIYDAIWLP